MSQVCPNCGTECSGSGPCSKCGAALGVQPSYPQARFVDVQKSFDWQPWVLTLVGLLLLCLFVGFRSHEKEARAQELTATTSGHRAGKIGGTSLIDLPPSDDTQPTAAVLPVGHAPATKSTTDASDTTDQTADDSTPTTTAPETAATQNPPSLVQIGLAQIATEQDTDGNSFAVGHVTIVNTGPNEITNFTLTLTTSDGTFALQPFQGSIENPVTITTRRIPAGGYLDVPVMTEGVFQSAVPGGQKVVNVSATENGQAVTDSTPIQ